MVKKGILSIIFAALLICGVVPQVNAYEFVLNSISIAAHSADPGLVIQTDASPYLSSPYTFNLSEGETTGPFSLFDIWTTEGQVSVGEDDAEKPITVAFDFLDATGGPITGLTRGFVTHEGTVIYPIIGAIFDWLNDEGQVAWDSSADFSFGGDGLFRITLSPTSFSQGFPSPIDGQWNSLASEVGLLNKSTVEATLFYEKAPTAVPVPPAIILLGTGILGIAGIRRKYKK